MQQDFLLRHCSSSFQVSLHFARSRCLHRQRQMLDLMLANSCTHCARSGTGCISCLLLATGKSAQDWVRVRQRQGGSSGGGTIGSGGGVASLSSTTFDGVQARLGSVPLQRFPEDQPPELIYSQGSFRQEQHSCPFDFSQPAPQDDTGKTLTYAECLAAHDRPLDEGYDFGCLFAPTLVDHRSILANAFRAFILSGSAAAMHLW